MRLISTWYSITKEELEDEPAMCGPEPEVITAPITHVFDNQCWQRRVQDCLSSGNTVGMIWLIACFGYVSVETNISAQATFSPLAFPTPSEGYERSQPRDRISCWILGHDSHHLPRGLAIWWQRCVTSGCKIPRTKELCFPWGFGQIMDHWLLFPGQENYNVSLLIYVLSQARKVL